MNKIKQLRFFNYSNPTAIGCSSGLIALCLLFNISDLLCNETCNSLFSANYTVYNSPDTATILNTLYIDEVVVTATRFKQNTFSSDRATTVLNRKRIQERNQLSLLDALDDRMGIWIEKRTTTASDPVIRGLSGANILALIDGNTLTGFWGEGGFAGDDMYGKIDPDAVERIEIIRGPASLMYGSNALGGVINFIHKSNPNGYSMSGFKVGGRVKGSFATSSNYGLGRLETWGASDRFKYFIGSSYQNAGNMRVGGSIGKVVPSGGKAWAFDFNTERRFSDSHLLSFSGQYFNRPEHYKSFRPKQMNQNERIGICLKNTITKNTSLFNIFEFTLYHQYKKDYRTWFTDINRETVEQEGQAWWKTYTANAHFIKIAGKNHTLSYGLGYHVDFAESPDDEQFTIFLFEESQFAAPNTRWANLGFYINNKWHLANLMTLSAGFRYDNFLLVADDNVFYPKPGSSDTISNKPITDPGRYRQYALTGSVSAIFHLSNAFNLVVNYSRGFRMFPPSFGLRQTGFGILTPNGLLDPIVGNMFEISPRIRSNYFSFDMAVYYTVFNNFQQPIEGTYNGQEYIDLNNNGIFENDERVYVNASNGDAFVTGVEIEYGFRLGLLTEVLNDFLFIGGYMYNYGRMQFEGKEEVPLRHTHPARLLFKLRYDADWLERESWLEVVYDNVGQYDQIEQSRLHSDVGYLDNPQDPTSGLYYLYGLPAYQLFHIRGGIKVPTYNISFSLAVENIFDIRYRAAHSRMDGSGRNFIFGLELTF